MGPYKVKIGIQPEGFSFKGTNLKLRFKVFIQTRQQILKTVENRKSTNHCYSGRRNPKNRNHRNNIDGIV